MASYAPLLTNINPGGLQWDTDLIGYNAEKSYGSPSYYAQAMFASHLGDHTLKSSADGAGAKFFYSITGSAAKKKLYLKLVNAASAPQAVDIDLQGAKVAPRAKLTSLAAKDTQATNSIDRPEFLKPADSSIAMSGTHLRRTVPPYAIEVIEFDEQ